MSVQELGSLLVERGLISAADYERARTEQKRTGEFLGTILTRLGIVSSERLLPLLSEQTGLPYVRLAQSQITPEVLAKVPPKFATHYRFMPVAFAAGVLQVAFEDPFDVQTLDEVKLLIGCELQPVLADPQEIEDAIQRHYGVGASAVERLLDTGAHEAAPAATRTEDLTDKPDDASVISFVNQLILSAARDRATDIHIEPFDQMLRVRQRIDGVMYEVPVPSELVRLQQAIVSRIKVMARLDIAERRLPQDGRIKVRLEAQELDLRISILPTTFGESVEIRLLSSQMLFSLEQLGLGADHRDELTKLIQKPHGIVFVTGPTGSGKSTTLYACLSKLNAPNVKILTIEDPIEYQLTGITQLQVHPKIGFTFAQGLRSMLRHDPDVMMVGEVRDPETAEITIRSALTGHLVFSTLHTNDSAGGITRLLDMGIEPYLVASSVLCFIAQRLVRVICPACKTSRPAEVGLLAEFGLPATPAAQAGLPPVEPLPTLSVGKGCDACKGTGFKGRTAIYEFLPVDESIHKLVLRRASSHEIALAAQQVGKMRTLRQDGWQKVLDGVTTPEEVLRVT